MDCATRSTLPPGPSLPLSSGPDKITTWSRYLSQESAKWRPVPPGVTIVAQENALWSIEGIKYCSQIHP